MKEKPQPPWPAFCKDFRRSETLALTCGACRQRMTSGSDRWSWRFCEAMKGQSAEVDSCQRRSPAIAGIMSNPSGLPHCRRIQLRITHAVGWNMTATAGVRNIPTSTKRKLCESTALPSPRGSDATQGSSGAPVRTRNWRNDSCLEMSEYDGFGRLDVLVGQISSITTKADHLLEQPGSETVVTRDRARVPATAR